MKQNHFLAQKQIVDNIQYKKDLDLKISIMDKQFEKDFKNGEQ